LRSVLCTKSGGIDNVGFGQQDVIDYLSQKRQKQIEKGDVQLMLSYFKNCQLRNPGFFMLSKWMWMDSWLIAFGLIQGPE